MRDRSAGSVRSAPAPHRGGEREGGIPPRVERIVLLFVGLALALPASIAAAQDDAVKVAFLLSGEEGVELRDLTIATSGLRQGIRDIAGLEYVGVGQTVNGIASAAEAAGYSILVKQLAGFEVPDIVPVVERVAQPPQRFADRWLAHAELASRAADTQLVIERNGDGQQIEIGMLRCHPCLRSDRSCHSRKWLCGRGIPPPHDVRRRIP